MTGGGIFFYFVEATSTPLKSGKRITLKQETEKWADELYPKTDESGAETPETS